MTNTDNAPAAKPTGKKDTTTVVEPRRGVGPGILIGAIAASLVGGLLLGGGAGALITRTIDLGERHGLVQIGQVGPLQGNGMPGQQGGQQGGFPGGPQQQGQLPPAPDGDSGTDDGTPDTDTDTDAG